MSRGGELLGRKDAEARHLAQVEFVRPLAVEAGAGTGKTAVLVARAVVWCLGPGWELAAAAAPDAPPRETAARALEGVVAITFTEAAAAEMAARVAQAMAAVAEGRAPLGVEPALLPAEARQRARALAAATHRLEARTIHSFCASLLRRWPVEAGVAPGFEVDADGTLTESEAFEVVEQAMRHALVDPPDPDWAVLAAAGAGPDRLVKAVADLAAAGGSGELERDPFAPEEIGALRGRTLAEVDGLLALVGNRLDAVSRGSTAADIALLRQVRQVLAAATGEAWLGATSPFGRRGESPRNRLGKWASGSFTQGEERALEGADRSLVSAAAARVAELAADLEKLEPVLYRAAARVLAPLVGATRARLVERGLIGFDGLLRSALDLLTTHPDVAREVRCGIHQLLVDEFQDTDRVQCEIVRRLALVGEPRPGLFVVGDPKQSIYGWRSADLGAYEEFRDDLEAAGGSVVRLAVSFRSVPPILAEVERIVAPVMQRRPGLQPEFQPLVASTARQQAPVFRDHVRGAVEAWLTWPPGEDGRPDTRARSLDRLEAEARAMVGDMLAVHREHRVEWRRMAVLLRSTSDLDRYLEAMRAAGVPFAVNRERAYYRQPEVVAAAALVRVLLDPSDALAQLSLLRSEAVGVPDAALLPLWRRGLPRLLASALRDDPGATAALETAVAEAEVPADVPGLERVEGWRDALGHAVRALVALRHELRERTAAVFVERARTLWPLEAAASARYLGGFRVARLERFWEELEGILDRFGDRPAAVARLLRRAVEEARESPVAPAPTAVPDAVQVMTIHGAKGLDFDHVYLPQLDKGTGARSGGRTTGLLSREGARAACLLGWPSPAYLAAERERGAVADCERVRLLYVAMTRARERLVLSAGWAGGADPDDPDRARSLLDLAGHRLSPEAARALLEDGGGRHEDGNGLRWRVAAAVVEDAGEPDGTGAIGHEPIPEVDPRRLEENRAAARRRMARRWAGTVTGEVHREQDADPDEAAEPGRPPASALIRGEGPVAAAVGTAVHEAMEALRPEDADLATSVAEGARARLAAAGLDDLWQEPARARLEEVLRGIRRGRCLARWQELAPGIVGRELALLIPPREDEGPVGFLTGAVDLVAVEAGDGRLVAVDFKTDLAADADGLDGRADRYRPQVAAYARALQGALGLEETPAAELWFLAADRIVRFDPP